MATTEKSKGGISLPTVSEENPTIPSRKQSLSQATTSDMTPKTPVTTRIFVCEVKVSSSFFVSRQNPEFAKIDGQKCQLLASAKEVKFHTIKSNATFDLAISDIKQMEPIDRKVLGFIKRKPTIRFSTYTGHRCILSNFCNKEELEDLHYFLQQRFQIQHSRSSYSRNRSQTFSDMRSPSTRQIQFVDSDDEFIEKKLTTKVNHTGILKRHETMESPVPDPPDMHAESPFACLKFHRQDSDSTIPPGKIQVLEPGFEPCPADQSLDPLPRRPMNIKWEKGAEFSLYGITVEQFFNLFYNNRAPGFFKEEPTKITSVTKWTMGRGEGFVPRRVIKGVCPTYEENNPIVPSHSQFKQDQWLLQYPAPENGCELKISCAACVVGVPLGTQFDNIEEWSIVPIPQEDGIRVTVTNGAHFHHRFCIAKAFRWKIVQGGQRAIIMYARHAKSFVEAYLENGQEYVVPKTISIQIDSDQDTDSVCTVELTSGSFRSETSEDDLIGLNVHRLASSNFCDMEAVVDEHIEDEHTFLDSVISRRFSQKTQHTALSQEIDNNVSGLNLCFRQSTKSLSETINQLSHMTACIKK